jgi:hypothetical protein
MPAYAIRVELRGNSSPAEYERLHTLMAQRGFGRTVTGVTKEKEGVRPLIFRTLRAMGLPIVSAWPYSAV